MAITRTAKGTASTGSGTSLTISGVSVASGTDIVVGLSTTNLSSVTWNGNAMSADFSSGNVSVYRLRVTSGGTGDIVATFGATFSAAMFAIELTNLAASPFDVSASATGTGTSPDSGLTATTAQADEFWLGLLRTASSEADNPGTWQNGFTAGQRKGSTTRTIQEGYKIVTATGQARAQLTGITSSTWQAVVVTYKEAAGSTYTLTADAGSYSVSGTAATLSKGSVVTAGAGAYTVAGTDATLTHATGAYSLDVDAGAYTVAGTDATLSTGTSLTAVAGGFTVTGTAATLSRGLKLTASAAVFSVRSDDVELLAALKERFVLNYSIDLLPAESDGKSYGQTLTADGTPISVRSWVYEETDRDISGKLDVELANISQRSLITKDANLNFSIITGSNGVLTEETLVDTGYLQRSDYTLSRSGIGPDDRFTLTGLTEMDSRLNTVPNNNLIFYDPAQHETVEPEDFEGVYDEEDNYYPPTVEQITELTFYTLLDEIFVTRCGFFDVQTTIPDFPIDIVEFQAGTPYQSTIGGLIGMFEPDYSAIDEGSGLILWIRDGTTGTPAGSPTPRQLTTSDLTDLGVAVSHGRIDNLLIHVHEDRKLFDETQERTENSSSTVGDADSFYPFSVTTNISTVYIDFYRSGKLVKTEKKRETRTSTDSNGLTWERTTEQFFYHAQGLLRYRLKTVESYLPNPGATWVKSLIESRREQENIFYKKHPYLAKTYYISKREINTSGLVVIDGENQQLGEDYSRDILNANRSGNLVETMDSDWRKISTFQEQILPQKNERVWIRSTELDYLTNQMVQNDWETRDGVVGVNLFVNEQKRIWIPYPITGPHESVNMGELPQPIALALGERILMMRNTLPNRISATVPGLDNSLQKGVAVNILGRNGADLGNYIIEGRRLEGGDRGYFTTITARQSS